jgi:uncharacterized protein (DUF885 family)
VVDTGIHDQGWTREQAIAYMLENTPMTEGDIVPEVERYIVWPAQALSYKIGMNTIVDLRERARRELGDASPGAASTTPSSPRARSRSRCSRSASS